MVERIADPKPEGRLRKELVPLPELVQLRVAIQESRGDELIEDTDDEGREDGEDDVVQRERPGLVGDLTGEVVEEGILQLVLDRCQRVLRKKTYPELRHVQHDVLVEGVCGNTLARIRRDGAILAYRG